jgi:hypothetical protein
MIEAPSSFAFVDGDRTFTCRVEAARHAPQEAWWFQVSTARDERHAPFRAGGTDARGDLSAHPAPTT